LESGFRTRERKISSCGSPKLNKLSIWHKQRHKPKWNTLCSWKISSRSDHQECPQSTWNDLHS
jgi:hypothetical protein